MIYGGSRASSSRCTTRLVLITPPSEQNTTHPKTPRRQRAPEERKRWHGGSFCARRARTWNYPPSRPRPPAPPGGYEPPCGPPGTLQFMQPVQAGATTAYSVSRLTYHHCPSPAWQPGYDYRRRARGSVPWGGEQSSGYSTKS